jgi:hypothetical protein
MSERYFTEATSVVEVLERKARHLGELAASEENSAETQEHEAKRLRKEASRHRTLADECRKAVAALTSNVEGR